MDIIDSILNEKVVLNVGSRVFQISFYDLIVPTSGMYILYYLFWKKTGFANNVIEKRTVQRISEKNPEDVPYQPRRVISPVVKGWLLSIYRRLFRSHALGNIVLEATVKKMDVMLHSSLPDSPTLYPLVTPDVQSDVEKSIDLETFIKPSDSGDDFHFNTISDYYTQYRNGSVTPLEVAKNVIKCIEDTCEKELHIIIGMTNAHKADILKRAEASTERWNLNKPLSVLDGIPVAVKGEMFLSQYPCLSGVSPKVASTRIMTENDEGWMVRKLREGGAIFIGVANLHQIGIGVTGINTCKFHGTSRNPYNPDFPCGGSSGGSAAAVSAGLCPIALGTDGGGSIRIPSSVCGIVGAKNTFGRMSKKGCARSCHTVGHTGPLCATVEDIRIAYGFLAGRDREDHLTLVQPPPQLSNAELPKGITIGIDWNFFNDCCPEILRCCKAAVNYLVENHGMEIIEISIPEIHESQRAHVMTISTEMYAASKNLFEIHHDDINPDTEVYLRFGKYFPGHEYFTAQQQRTRCINIFKRLFKEVDCIITPSCAEFVPKLDASILKSGILDSERLLGIMRYMSLGNFAGNPSVSVPIGYSSVDNLPIGILIHTAWWEEDLMYQVADAVKNHLELRRPRIYYDILNHHGSQ